MRSRSVSALRQAVGVWRLVERDWQRSLAGVGVLDVLVALALRLAHLVAAPGTVFGAQTPGTWLSVGAPSGHGLVVAAFLGWRIAAGSWWSLRVARLAQAVGVAGLLVVVVGAVPTPGFDGGVGPGSGALALVLAVPLFAATRLLYAPSVCAHVDGHLDAAPAAAPGRLGS